MRNRLVTILALLVLSMVTLAAQEVEWSVDMGVTFNNREGSDDSFALDQTFLFTRLAPELGVSMMDGTHVFKGGIAWYQPIVDDLSGYKVVPTLYYRYNRPDGWHMTAGMMPRSLMVNRLPSYLLSDSLAYTQPNLRGVMIQLIKPAGYAQLAVDWRQMQTEFKREAFTITASTDWRLAGPLRLGGHVQYSHLAMSRRHLQGEHVNDDLIINPMLSLDLSSRCGLDSLRVSAGAIISMQRDRGVNQWLNRGAGMISATARWHWLQLDETFTAGKDLMPLYPMHGSKLIQGDPYYSRPLYSRTDVTAHVVNNRFVDLTASLMLHVTDKATGFWQQVSCRFYLDSRLWKRRHDRSYLNSGRLQQLY